jgi:RHS repeat-associated protein
VDGALYYVHRDHLGSTVAVSDAAGGAVGRVQYNPYGEVLTSTLPVTLTDRLFTGARFDGTIGLYQMGARWYDPALGRWIQADSIVPNSTNPQDLNRYTYVRNNPLRYTDPTEHAVCTDVECTQVVHLVTGDIIQHGARGHPSHGETHSSHMVEKLAHKGADLIHAYEAFHRFSHGVEMARGGFRLARGATYAGQVIVYGTHEAKALAGLPTHLTHARAATHPGLIRYTNRWVAAGEAIRSPWTVAALGIVYGVDVYEYQWGSKHDVGLASTEFASAMTADTIITLGPPAVGAGFGSFFGPVGTVVGTGLGYVGSIGWSLLGREATVSFTDEHIITPLWEGYQHTMEVKMQHIQEEPYMGLMWGATW